MELNEIKKALYKQSPDAIMFCINKNGINYEASIINEGSNVHLTFVVPINDMGDADFLPTMEAKLLIRWIIND